MIRTLTLNPALDKTVVIPNFRTDTVNRIDSLRLDPGGKGINVSKVVQKLGGESYATALLGGSTGDLIFSMLAQQGIRVDRICVPGQTRTNLKIIDPVLKTNTDINEPGVSLTINQWDDVLAHFISQVTADDIVVLAGSVPAGAPADIYARCIQACDEIGAKTFLDADGPLLATGIAAGPYLIKPNLDELKRVVQQPLESLKQIKAAGLTLLEQGIQKVLISMGEKGALYLTADICLFAPALSVPVGSTVGAGDSVVAALAIAEEKGLSPSETLALAIATGAANVMCSGTQAADLQQIQALLPLVRYQSV